jgi:nitrogen fixation protein NifU and related proteins
MYQDVILDHYRHPRHRGLREPYDVQVHHVNPVCGDEVTVRVRLASSGGAARVEDVSYEGLGCSISQASASIMTELVIGQTVDDALVAYDAFLALMQSRGAGPRDERDDQLLDDAVAFSGVSQYPSRIKCALLGWAAWKDATAQAVATMDNDDSSSARGSA